MLCTEALIWDICPASEGDSKLYHHTMEIWFFLLSLWLSMQPTPPPSAYTFESFSWFNYYYTLPTPLYIVQIYTKYIHMYIMWCVYTVYMYIYTMSIYIYIYAYASEESKRIAQCETLNFFYCAFHKNIRKLRSNTEKQIKTHEHTHFFLCVPFLFYYLFYLRSYFFINFIAQSVAGMEFFFFLFDLPESLKIFADSTILSTAR